MNDVKESIILSAISAIAENGIEKVSNKIIAEKCGVSSASIYDHFENKRDLLFNVMYYIVEKEAEILNNVLNCENSCETNYSNMLTAMVTYYSKNKDVLLCYLKFLFIRQNTESERVNMIDNLCPLTLFLKNGIRNGEIREISDTNDSYDVLSIAFYPLCWFLGSHFNKNKTPSDNSVRAFIQGLWAAIKK